MSECILPGIQVLKNYEKELLAHLKICLFENKVEETLLDLVSVAEISSEI